MFYGTQSLFFRDKVLSVTKIFVFELLKYYKNCIVNFYENHRRRKYTNRYKLLQTINISDN